MSDTRPNPDALLAAIQQEDHDRHQGRLRIYLGMAAGVGKTYSMLQDAGEHARRGVDVVIGYLEAHGRAETEALAENLEKLPLKEIPYGGVFLKEFDLDGALARKPDLILVDELAHTNAPGCRHLKRYQDVLELLEAGVDVDTTVNVQHLESLNDVVAQITGIIVREKIPDSLLERADEIELVDVPPEELLQRLREGKIYVPEKIDHALDGFFKKANLSALRELALRKTADRVDVQVLNYRTASGAQQSWHAAPRILICVAPNSLASRIVRAGFNLASTLHAEVIVVTVESARQAGVAEHDRLEARRALQLAESMGAQVMTLAGDHIVAEVIRTAHDRNATMVIVGKPVRPRWREILFGSVVDELVRCSGNIDVHVITDDGKGTPPTPVEITKPKMSVRGMVEVVIVTSIGTGICESMSHHFDKANLVMVYLAAVTLVAVRQGLYESVVASVLAVGAFDFFFVAPRGTFAVTDAQYLFTFAIMLVVALLISSLTVRLREQAATVSDRERRTSALYELSRKIAGSRSRQEIGQFAIDKVKDLLLCEAAVWRKDRKLGTLVQTPGSISGFEMKPGEQAVSQWVADRGRPAGNGTDTLPGAEALHIPLKGAVGTVGVLSVQPPASGPFTPGQVQLLESVANQVALAFERANYARASNDARVEAEAERLRSTLLSSVSHDLRTPLSVISGAAGKLAEPGETSYDQRQELAQSIVIEADRLNMLVRNLLDMTRLENPSLEIRRDWQSAEELVGSALSRTRRVLSGRPLVVDVAPDLPFVLLDGILIEQLLVNLLENAARHTPEGTEVTISARAEEDSLSLAVLDRGPGIANGQQEAIFGKFRKDEASSGVGLGLAICRAIAEAHGGRIGAVNRPGGGAEFRAWFPLPKSGEGPTVVRED